MIVTECKWTSDHPRFVIGRSSVGKGAPGFGEPFAVVAVEANAGWRVDEHPQFVTDLTGDGGADIIGFGDDGVWISLGDGDGCFQPAFVLEELGFDQGWRVDGRASSCGTAQRDVVNGEIPDFDIPVFSDVIKQTTGFDLTDLLNQLGGR